ncbi:hypothetical protein [Halobacillus litoralis]|uniref:hypothetical protein n=1 Tax=Halobacillus litoralis TaxID=45668 RepID=UPI00136BAD24|nr:hypothetical protein [Halobacillus litoralis]MYL36878.1 hypothetical protein [Halobacillus litoralis]
MKSARRLVMFVGMVFLLIAITSYSSNDSTDQYRNYFSLRGEGKQWVVKHYQLEFSPESIKAGNGNIVMKGRSEYSTDSYHFHVYALYGDEKKVIQSHSVNSHEDLDITHIPTGTIESSDGISLPPDQIKKIYMTIEWYDMESEQWLDERIDLFNKDTSFN